MNIASALASLVVTLAPVESAKGPILYSVYDNDRSWNKQENARLEGAVAAEQGQVRIELALAPGTYAFTAFHDANSNGNLDTNFLGLPKEYFGISLITHVLWSQPHWDEVKFEIIEGQVRELQLLMKLQ